MDELSVDEIAYLRIALSRYIDQATVYFGNEKSMLIGLAIKLGYILHERLQRP